MDIDHTNHRIAQALERQNVIRSEQLKCQQELVNLQQELLAVMKGAYAGVFEINGEALKHPQLPMALEPSGFVHTAPVRDEEPEGWSLLMFTGTIANKKESTPVDRKVVIERARTLVGKVEAREMNRDEACTRFEELLSEHPSAAKDLGRHFVRARRRRMVRSERRAQA